MSLLLSVARLYLALCILITQFNVCISVRLNVVSDTYLCTCFVFPLYNMLPLGEFYNNCYTTNLTVINLLLRKASENAIIRLINHNSAIQLYCYVHIDFPLSLQREVVKYSILLDGTK